MPDDIKRDTTEVGAVWAKKNDRGEYYSVSLDLDALAKLRGGEITGKVDLNMYPNLFKRDNPRAPDYRLKFYSRTESRERRPARAPHTPVDDDADF